MTSNGTTRPAALPGLHKPGPNTKEAFSICIYGRGGVGKTTLLGTMPGKGLLIDVPQIEGGTFVLERQSERIDVVPVEEWVQIDPIFWFLKQKQHNYDWVAIDSITAMSQLAIRKTIGDRSDALVVDPHQISLPEWGKIGRLVGELVMQFRKLPIHTIWIAQERKFGGEGEPNITGPDISPSALSMLLPPLLMMGRLYIEYGMDGTPERRLRVRPHPEYHAKIRARPGLDVPAVIKDPNIGVILKYVLGSGERPKEADESGFVIIG